MKNFLQNNMSLESLITIFSQAPVALAMLMGEDMVIGSANEKVLELWRKTSDIIGLPLLDALPEIKDQEFPNILRNVYKTGVIEKGEKVLALLEKDGVIGEYYFNYIYSPVYKDKEIIGISVVATEVTDQVVSEMKLRESEFRFKEILEISDYSTAIYYSEDLHIQFANDRMIKTWGKDRTVIGKKLEEALPELEDQPYIKILKNIFKTGLSYVAEEDKVDLVVDGQLQSYYFNFSFKPIKNTRGEVYAILNIAVDVTEMVNSRKKVQESEARYKDLAEAMPQIVWTTGGTGKLDYFNENMMRFLNRSHEELSDFEFLTVIHPDDVPKLVDIWESATQTKKSFEIELRFKDVKTGLFAWFNTKATPILDENGNILQWIGTCTDINEFKNLVAQKDTFLGIASHELKTPLTSLKLYAQVLERKLKKSGDEKNAEFARKMDLQVIKLTSLIADLLDVTKINAGKIHLNKQNFDFEKLAVETIEEQQMSTSHKIEYHTAHVGTVFADRDRIGQVITNLISNAIKYSPNSEKIIISVENEGENVMLCIQDFGIGMPEEKKDKVFEQYYRVSGDDQTTIPGLGLGLFIAAQIIERSRGKIWVNSILGKGSTFCFSLPKVEA